MFPDAHWFPASFLQLPVRVAVAFAVPLDLLAPERWVTLRPSAVLGAAVPEATVYEDRNASGPKHDVRLPPKRREWPAVHPIAQPHVVKGVPQRQFNLRVPARLASHAGSDLVGRLQSGHWTILHHLRGGGIMP